MNTDNIKNIIFDYGNVIFDINVSKCQQAFIDIGVSNIESFFSTGYVDQVFKDFETGAVSPAQFRDRIRTLGNKPSLTDGEVDRAWNALQIGVQPSNHQLLNKLKGKYRLFLLSNNNEIHYNDLLAHLKNVHGIDSNSVFFEKTYYSHHLGMRKPNANIYNHVIDDAGIKKEETLFIDDNAPNIEGAIQAGIPSLLMTAKPIDLAAFLQKNGIKA